MPGTLVLPFVNPFHTIIPCTYLFTDFAFTTVVFVQARLLRPLFPFAKAFDSRPPVSLFPCSSVYRILRTGTHLFRWPSTPYLSPNKTTHTVRPSGGHVVCGMHRGRALDKIRDIPGIIGVRSAEPDFRPCGDPYVADMAFGQRAARI